jgi:HEAT repeat protein
MGTTTTTTTTIACVSLTLLVGLIGCGNDRNNRFPDKDAVWARPPKQPPKAPPRQEMPIDPALTQAAMQEIQSAVRSEDPIIRAHAIEAVRRAMPTEGRDVILKGLVDDASVVRFASAMAAGELRLAAAKPILTDMLSDPSRNVQIAVRFALHRLGDTSNSHDLERTARDPDKRIRANTVVALGLLGEKSALNILRPMQNDRDPAIRLQVAEAMWRLGNADGRNSLVAATLSAYPDDQMVAFLGLAAPRDTRVREHVRAGLTNDYVEVTLVAARAMGMLGSDEGYGVAMQGASSVDPRQRSLAALAFGAIGRSDAQPILGPMLKDSDPDVRLSAATALLQLK